jgi:hypothetical protein
MQAQIVRTTLQERRRDRTAKHFADQWKVAVIKLILQGLRAGRDNRLAAGEQRRNEVGKRLAGAGAGFDHEFSVFLEGFRHRFRHESLTRARLKSREVTPERTGMGEEISEAFHDPHNIQGSSQMLARCYGDFPRIFAEYEESSGSSAAFGRCICVD